MVYVGRSIGNIGHTKLAIKVSLAALTLSVSCIEMAAAASASFFEVGFDDSESVAGTVPAATRVSKGPRLPLARTSGVLFGAVSETGPAASAAQSVLLDMGPSKPRAERRVAVLDGRFGQAGLPSPRRMSNELSAQQETMRELAAETARRYARAPGVVRARLDDSDFVTLFTSMIHRESNFNPRAVSPAGAKGLGQLMPGTAEALGVCDVFSAQDNLDGAAEYLTAMLDRFGSVPLALAAYNAGPGAVEKYDGVPPYAETTQYVADIMNAMASSNRSGARSSRDPKGLLDVSSLQNRNSRSKCES